MATNNNVATGDWWVLTIRGILSVLFGLAAIFWPGLTLVTLIYLFSAYILLMGIVGTIQSLGSIGKRPAWILSLLLGFLQIGVGVYLIRHLGVTYSAIVLIVGFIFIVQGILDGVAAFAGNQSGAHRTLLIIAALLSLLAGIVVLAYPVRSGLAIVWVIGLYALILGPIEIALSIDVKHQLEGSSSKA